MKDWHEIAQTFATNGLSAPQITKSLIELGLLTDVPYRVAYDRVRKYVQRHPTGTVKKAVVIQNFIPKVYDENPKTNIIRFGLIGDTQINSKYAQLTYLHDFYNICSAQGIDTVYHTGDIDDGDQMRIGHQYELYKVGADDHVDEIVSVYPMRTGITTKFITGNHDASIYKRCGCDIGKAIAARRPDMEYLGRDCAVVKLTPNCTLELRHPWDGTSTAISQRIQKMIDTMDSDAKPDILAVGHYHKMEQLLYRGVFAFQTGCFQSATPFTVGKGISVTMGGWIVEVEVDNDGYLQNVKAQFIPYKKAIKDDYMNFHRG